MARIFFKCFDVTMTFSFAAHSELFSEGRLFLPIGLNALTKKK